MAPAAEVAEGADAQVAGGEGPESRIDQLQADEEVDELPELEPLLLLVLAAEVPEDLLEPAEGRL